MIARFGCARYRCGLAVFVRLAVVSRWLLVAAIDVGNVMLGIAAGKINGCIPNARDSLSPACSGALLHGQHVVSIMIDKVVWRSRAENARSAEQKVRKVVLGHLTTCLLISLPTNTIHVSRSDQRHFPCLRTKLSLPCEELQSDTGFCVWRCIA